MDSQDSGSRRPRGRPAASSPEHIERVAMDLFLANGYSATTIRMITESSGVSRTTFFRYWGSKAEIIWGVFDVHTRRLGSLLENAGTSEAPLAVVRRMVVQNMRMSVADSALWIERFAVLDSAPELRPEESAHWNRWADTVAAYIAVRTGLPAAGVVASGIAGAVQAAFLATLRQWLDVEAPSAERFLPRLDAELRPLCTVLQQWLDESCP